MTEPESLDEQALEEEVVWLHFPGFPPIKGIGPVITEQPPEYQHPEDTMEVFKEYDRITDEHLGEE